MNQNEAIEKARRFGQTAFQSEVTNITRLNQEQVDDERERLAAFGLSNSSSMVRTTAKFACNLVKALIEAELNALLDGCEAHGVVIDDKLASEFADELTKHMNALTDREQRNVIAGVPAATQSNYTQIVSQNLSISRGWIETQIDRRRLMSKNVEQQSVEPHRKMSPKRAIEILKKLVGESMVLPGEAFTSPKRTT